MNGRINEYITERRQYSFSGGYCSRYWNYKITFCGWDPVTYMNPVLAQRAKAEGLRVQGYSKLHGKFKASLDPV